MRPDIDRERYNVVVDAARIRRILLRIAADVDELARARRIEDLDTAAVDPPTAEQSAADGSPSRRSRSLLTAPASSNGVKRCTTTSANAGSAARSTSTPSTETSTHPKAATTAPPTDKPHGRGRARAPGVEVCFRERDPRTYTLPKT